MRGYMEFAERAVCVVHSTFLACHELHGPVVERCEKGFAEARG
jgi:hypothetical protein